MEVLEIAQEIKKKIDLLEIMRKEIRERGEAKARAIAEYEKSLAVTIIQLKNGVQMELEGQMIQNPGATITEKIARGITWEKKIEMEKCEALYKSLICNIDSVQAEINALQSLNRYLDKA